MAHDEIVVESLSNDRDRIESSLLMFSTSSMAARAVATSSSSLFFLLSSSSSDTLFSSVIAPCGADICFLRIICFMAVKLFGCRFSLIVAPPPSERALFVAAVDSSCFKSAFKLLLSDAPRDRCCFPGHDLAPELLFWSDVG